jgi:hypothetical protein
MDMTTAEEDQARNSEDRYRWWESGDARKLFCTSKKVWIACDVSEVVLNRIDIILDKVNGQAASWRLLVDGGDPHRTCKRCL